MIAADWIVTLPLSPDAIMIIISVIYLLGGSFIADLSFMVLATPIFYPVIMFDLKCDADYLTSGIHPKVKVQKYSGCAAGDVLFAEDAVYQNDWHANWDTTGWAAGLYKVSVVLPNGAEPYALVELK